MVNLVVDTDNILNKPEAFYKTFDIVCLLGFSREIQVKTLTFRLLIFLRGKVEDDLILKNSGFFFALFQAYCSSDDRQIHWFITNYVPH